MYTIKSVVALLTFRFPKKSINWSNTIYEAAHFLLNLKLTEIEFDPSVKEEKNTIVFCFDISIFEDNVLLSWIYCDNPY